MTWKICWWICVVLFSIFILTDPGAAGCQSGHHTSIDRSGINPGS